MEILMQRRIYPFLLMVVSLIGILSFQIRQFKRLYEHIKNDKYGYLQPLYILKMFRLCELTVGVTVSSENLCELRKNKCNLKKNIQYIRTINTFL